VLDDAFLRALLERYFAYSGHDETVDTDLYHGGAVLEFPYVGTRVGIHSRCECERRIH